jgi:hypothetical protein
MDKKFFDVDTEKILKQVYEFTKEYQQQFLTHSPFIIAIMLYISFLVISQYFYRPSYTACISSGGTPILVTLVLANCLFFTYLIFYFIKGFLPSDFSNSLNSFTNILYLSMIIIIIVYGVLIFRCIDKSACDNCDTSELTMFNDKILYPNVTSSVNALSLTTILTK